MKQDSEEEKIKRLFHELRKEDERLVSSFAADWEAALSRHERPRRPRRTLSVAVAAAAVLILLGGSVFIFLRHSSSRSVQVTTDRTPAAPITRSQPAPAPRFETPEDQSITSVTGHKRLGNRSSEVASGKHTRSIGRRTATPSRPWALVSQWRSPTDFLLTSPGDQLLKTIPRLGESLREIKAIMPEEKN